MRYTEPIYTLSQSPHPCRAVLAKKMQPLVQFNVVDCHQDNTSPDEIQKAHDSGMVKAVKLYPAGIMPTTFLKDALVNCSTSVEVFEAISFGRWVNGNSLLIQTHTSAHTREHTYTLTHIHERMSTHIRTHIH